MDENQREMVRIFVLEGFSQTPPIEAGLFVLLIFFYVPTSVGNVLILVTVASDNYLNSSPMYFLLGNPSFLDLCYSTISKLLADFLDNEKLIRYGQCIVQLFFLHFVGAVEMFLLTVMAYDLYVAICCPLHYTTIMSQGLHCYVGSCLLDGSVCVIYCPEDPCYTFAFFVDQTRWTTSFVMFPHHQTCLCGHIIIELLMASNSGLISTSSFITLFSSYSANLAKIHSKEGRQKALSSCGSHLMVLTLFFGPSIFIYARPLSTFSVDKMVSVLYNVITLMLNPLIYTLCNKEVKAAMQKLWDTEDLLGKNRRHKQLK